jgi:hypothetical protein
LFTRRPAPIRVIDAERLEAEDSTFRYADTYVAGVYIINWRRGADEEISEAVNYDPDEVDPVIVSKDKLGEQFDGEARVFCKDPANIADTIRRLRQGESIWEIFLFVVLIALVAEVYVANRRVSKDEQTEPLPRVRITSRRHSVRDWIVRQEKQTA